MNSSPNARETNLGTRGDPPKRGSTWRSDRTAVITDSNKKKFF